MLDCHWHDYVTHLIISELIYITYIFPHRKIWWNLDYKMWSYWLNTMIKIFAQKMLQWCPLPDWPYLYQYVTLCNDIHIAGKPRCKAFEQCLRHCIWFSIYGDMDQSIHIATSLQHFFCSLYKKILIIKWDMTILVQLTHSDTFLTVILGINKWAYLSQFPSKLLQISS